MKIFENGSVWLKSDFHLHTKADKEFKYSGDENEYVTSYIDKLKKENINIGVITNHNKFDIDEFKTLKKKAKKENIGLFSGVELSVNDGANGIHCLIVFDYTAWYSNGEDYINQFLTSAFEGIANRENENTRCNYNLTQLLKKLDEHSNQGRDSFIILAHVEQRSGFFNELDGGRIQQFSNDELFKKYVLGFQKVRTRDEVSKWKVWLGDRLPAFVEGSDCKDIDEVGVSHTQNGENKLTYIKVGELSFEALKYALMDWENRVSNDIKPIIKNAYIKSISFEGGLLDNNQINFSPELNTLIGIRGSGKSSILEILRHSLGITLSSITMDSKYKDGLIENVLKSGGKVTIDIVDRHNEEYRIEKIYGQREDIYKDGVLQPTISIGAIMDYPVYFGQKDLSNKDADFESDLINRLIGTKLKSIQSKINDKKREIENIVIEIKKLRNLSDLKKETNQVINNAKHQLESFKSKGIEEKLRNQTIFESDIAKLKQVYQTIYNYLSDINTIVSNHSHFFENEIKSSEINRELFNEVNVYISQLKNEFEKIKEVSINSKKNLGKIKDIINKIDLKKEGLKEEFAKIKRELNTDSINPDKFLTLNRQIETSLLKLKEIEKNENKRVQLENILLNELVELENLWHKEYKILDDEVQRINNSENKLSINVEYKGRRDKFLEKIKQIFKGTGIRETAYQEIEQSYKDFIQIYRDDSKLNEILSEGQLTDFKRRFSESLDELLVYQVESKINIMYNSKSLDKHSLGQRASALILFLLAQKDNDILIIDQPEDDLDNQTIYDEVIKEIKKMKGGMQFIFATHNANIPVLGDSEKVIVCSFDDKKMNVHSGTIDNTTTQKNIVDIMEGGNEAFNRRKNIYGMWNV